MDYLRTLPGGRREPPGLERRLLRRLPTIALAGTLVPLFFAVASHLFPSAGADADLARHLQFVDHLAIAVVVTHWAGVLTAAIGCVVVILMKGPAYVADRYDLTDSDRPRGGG
jgi:hypothetical protein